MKKIKKHIVKILFLSLITITIFSCQKQEVAPSEFFNAKINNSETLLTNKQINISKGITIIAGYNSNKEDKSIIIITVHGDKEGSYKQEYDYKTGVSVTQCGLTHKTISKKQNGYFTSYEGKVTISKIDKENKKISGHYTFKVRSIPDSKNVKEIKGKFTNLSYK